jgi:hypothetical protein
MVKNGTVLKFVHITKTGGTSIEVNANNKGISWGLFDMKLKSYYKDEEIHFWHIPIRYIESNKRESLLEDYEFFTVVRDPYTRCLSEFYFFVCMGWIDAKHTRESLNETICKYINSKPDRDHWAPQSLFVYDERGEQIVKHILRFENLDNDFSTLMKEYNLDIQLVTRENIMNKIFTVNDLYPVTVKLINDFYHEDFVNFGYQKILT